MSKNDALRADLQVIAELIPEQTRWLDVGCGDGELLAWLNQHKATRGRGLEIDAARVNAALSRGVAVVQGDINTDLADFPDHAFDYVVLSQSLQMLKDPKATLLELMRLAEWAVVSVPNFAHWRNRIQLALNGRMPVTSALSYSWYETPNIHFCTLTDFIALCETLDIRIEKRLAVRQDGALGKFRGTGWLANLLAEQGVFLLHR